MYDYGNRFSEAVYSYVLKDGQCFGVTGYRGDACGVLCMTWKPVSWPQITMVTHEVKHKQIVANWCIHYILYSLFI